MKKILVIIYLISIITFPISSFCQKADNKMPDEFNFYKIKEQNKKALSAAKKDTSSFDNDFVRNKRFEEFWSTRVDNKNGDMRLYYQRMQEHYKSQLRSSTVSLCSVSPGCGDCCYPSNWTYFGPQTLKTQNLGKINAVWVDPITNQNILAGAEGGLFKTTDGGLNWNNITDFCLPGIGVYSIAVEPNSNNNIIYVSTGYITPTAHNDHYYGYGVFKTTDGGIKWNKMNISYGNAENGLSYKVVINPASSNIVYAIVGSQVFKTLNATASIPTWESIFGIIQNPNNLQLVDLEVRPLNLIGTPSDEVYISSSCKLAHYGCTTTALSGTFNWGDISGFCQTDYTAKVWQLNLDRTSTNLNSYFDLTLSSFLPSYNPVTLSVAISLSPTSITIACQSNYNASPTSPLTQIKIYRKLLSGNSWSNIATTDAPYGFPFEVSGADERIMYIGAGGVLYKSIDNGATFNPLWNYWDFWSNPNKAGSHPDVRALMIYKSTLMPGSNDELFWGDDGGIGKTINGGNTTLNLNGKGLQLTQFQGISNSEALPNLVYGGTQDNGLLDNKIQSWSVYPWGDGYQCVVDDNLNPPKAYSTVNGSILTTMGAGSWSSVWPLTCPTGSSCWNVPMYIDNNSNFYLGSHDLFKRFGNSWINITNFNIPAIGSTPAVITQNSSMTDIAVSANGYYGYISYDGPVWGAMQQNKIFQINNFTTSPMPAIDISAGLVGIDWSDLTNIATNEAGTIVWACFGGLWDVNKKVFKWENNAWSEYGQGLPNIPANAIEYLNNSNDMLFLGMDDGVYYRDKNMSEWKEFRCGLPHTIISGLKINYATKKLRAATHSRGIWETNITQNVKTSLCSNNISAIAAVSGQASSNNNLSNGIIVPVLSAIASVTINLANYCDGQTNCSNSQVNWKIFRDGIQLQTGIGPIVSFNGLFKTGLFHWTKHNYRVEVNIVCGNIACQTLIYNFNAN